MKNIDEVEKWLIDHAVNNYLISENLQITVHGNVNLNDKLKTQKLPVKFKLVDGYFDISNNRLTSLEGCPNIVTKDFNCSRNNLDSLFEGPEKVGDFDCSFNNLKSLSYAPKDVKGYFDCSNNQITSLKGSPRTIRSYFKCSNNKITSLKGGPKYIESYFDCSFNSLEKLSGGPLSVGQDYICNGNSLVDLDSIADEIGWDLITDIRLNHVDCSFNEESETWKYKGNEIVAHIYKPLVALTNIDDISRWLRKQDIKSFTILKDNSVDIHGDVKLHDKLTNLLKLPLKFNKVEGDFDISDNELTTLEGCPKIVTGDFLAYKNEITSLRGSPKEVGGNYVILQNNISSLKFAPTLVKEDFICSHNPLRNLDGLNTVLGHVFTGIYLPKVKSQKFIYKGIPTYKYPGELVMKFLDREYVSFTDEEIAFDETRKKLEKVVTNMLRRDELKKDMINDNLINNLKKYHLDTLRDKVLKIKNPPDDKRSKHLSESEISRLAFEKEI